MRFPFSPDRYRTLRKRSILLGVSLSAGIGLTAYPIFGLLAGLGCFFGFRRMLARQRASWLEIGNDEIRFGCGAEVERVAFADIRTVQFVRSPQGAIYGLKVFAADRMFVLSDFEHLYEIEAALEPLAARIESRTRTELVSHSVWWVAVAIGPAFFFLILNPATTKHAALIWGLGVQVLCCVLGLNLVFRAPISRSHGSRYRKAECVIGLLLALTNGAQAVLLLSGWQNTVAAFDRCVEAPDRPAFQECFRRELTSAPAK